MQRTTRLSRSFHGPVGMQRSFVLLLRIASGSFVPGLVELGDARHAESDTADNAAMVQLLRTSSPNKLVPGCCRSGSRCPTRLLRVRRSSPATTVLVARSLVLEHIMCAHAVQWWSWHWLFEVLAARHRWEPGAAYKYWAWYGGERPTVHPLRWLLQASSLASARSRVAKRSLKLPRSTRQGWETCLPSRRKSAGDTVFKRQCLGVAPADAARNVLSVKSHIQIRCVLKLGIWHLCVRVTSDHARPWRRNQRENTRTSQQCTRRRLISSRATCPR